ncbi:hypothetical protein [Acidisoma sp. 7E03]
MRLVTRLVSEVFKVGGLRPLTGPVALLGTPAGQDEPPFLWDPAEDAAHDLASGLGGALPRQGPGALGLHLPWRR